jgi:GTP-binding protein
MNSKNIRNIAIIAHVDHGKTTLVDKLLNYAQTPDEREVVQERLMDNNDLEKERGITILAKNTSVDWNGYRINIIDTPGHADFGGEVERVLRVVDSVLLLVDAVEGPMPQTRFVTQKSLELGLKPIVVINKIDRDGARADWVIDKVFDLFVELNATDEQLDFNVVYASALNGYSGDNPEIRSGDMKYIMDTVVEKVPGPKVDVDGDFQLQVIALSYDNYKGLIGTGRVQRGMMKEAMTVAVAHNGETKTGKIAEIFTYKGLARVNIKEACAGDIVSFSGIDKIYISDTLCSPKNIDPMPQLTVEEPTVCMTFQVNTSPFAGNSGKLLTSRQIKERLDKELMHNVALRVEAGSDADKFQVSGRGELHLSILIETMRREGFEMGVSRPKVIFKEIDGKTKEPYEDLTIDTPVDFQGSIMEEIGKRKGIMKDMIMDDYGRVRIDFVIPSRGLIGFRTDFMTLTQGKGLLFSTYSHYGDKIDIELGNRNNGVLISIGQGKCAGYSLFNLQERGTLYVGHGDEVYEGMVIGLHSRGNDLVINPLKGKQLTNMRASGTDENINLTPPIKFTLEQALEFIDDDELVEVTPAGIRIRKTYLKENERRKYKK